VWGQADRLPTGRDDALAAVPQHQGGVQVLLLPRLRVHRSLELPEVRRDLLDDGLGRN
jgi:hypothetical protein